MKPAVSTAHGSEQGHPSSRGWTTLQTVRTHLCTKLLSAQYRDGHLWISTWTWDTASKERGLDVQWEMKLELQLEHHAVVTLGSVYADGMCDHLRSLLGAAK
jgi:hypothetical protein